VLPDGTPFSIPDRDLAPAGRSLEGRLSPTETKVGLHFGLRVHRAGEIEMAAAGDEAGDRRYSEVRDRLTDSTGGGEAREVRLAEGNFRVLFPDEDLGDYDTLPLAEAIRRPEGGFAYRADFVPPCLAIAASPALMQSLRRLVEILVAKSSELSDRRRTSGRGAAEFGRDDTTGFWLLGTVNGAIPLLSHFLRSGEVHPEELYRSLVTLAGTLLTLSDVSVRELPPYDHALPALSLLELGRRIPDLLEVVLPRNYTRIPLTQRDAYVQVGRIQDDRVLDPQVSFFLGVYANMPLADVQGSFPEMAKVASPDKVDFLVAHALSGVPLRLTQSLPAALPVQGGYVYFLVDRASEAWEGIAGSRSIAIYAPPEFPGVRLELIAVRD
jgi:type VI secretion system protein ImpJ